MPHRLTVVGIVLVTVGCAATTPASDAPAASTTAVSANAAMASSPTLPPSTSPPDPTTPTMPAGPTGTSAARGAIESIGRMTVPRAAHSATLLTDGTVLIAGGCTQGTCETGAESATAELYLPAERTFVRTGSMVEPRVGHAAMALPDGRILLIGGFQGRSVTATTESRRDPARRSGPRRRWVAAR